MPVTYAPLWRILDERQLTTMQLRVSTGIAPNTITRLRHNKEVSLSILERICDFLKCDFGNILSYIPEEHSDYTALIGTFTIKNRRYLGNKYKLLPFISRVVKDECHNIASVADIFSGTGSVASAFHGCRIITNDILYSNYICNFAWFSSLNFDERKIAELICHYNSIHSYYDNYMTRNFADTYFSRDDCSKIGFIREDIEKRFNSGFIKARFIVVANILKSQHIQLPAVWQTLNASMRTSTRYVKLLCSLHATNGSMKDSLSCAILEISRKNT